MTTLDQRGNSLAIRTILLIWSISFVSRAIASADSQLTIDLREVPADLHVPEISQGPAAAGCRVRQVTPGWQGTKVHHVLYLPVDWRPGRLYPLIVEYTGNGPYRNDYGDVSLGRVEDADLGYGISAGREFIWISLPFLNGDATANVTQWWGDPPAYDVQPTVDYCQKTIPWLCQQYGADRERVLLAGFSRGAIACNYVGLHDDHIAGLWRAMIAYSHYDGVHPSWPYSQSHREAARGRLARLGNRPQLICSEKSIGSSSALSATRAYLTAAVVEGDFTFLPTGFRNHDDAWILRPSPAREKLRCWVREVMRRSARKTE